MRKRKLYRYQYRPADPGLVSSPPTSPADDYEQGVRAGLTMAAQRYGQALAGVRREAIAAARSDPYLLMARRRGFEEGFAAGARASSLGSPPPGAMPGGFSYADVENARQRGIHEGRQAAAALPRPDNGEIRRQAVADMLENCRVIAESNPNMDSTSFMKAVQHRSKKL